MGGDGSAAAPEVLMEGGGSVALPHELTEGGGSVAVPHEPMEGGGSVTVPHEPMEGSGPIAAPSETRETSLPTSEQGSGSKRSHPHELEQGSGGLSPKHTRRPKAPEYVTDSPRFSPFYFSVPTLCLFPFCRFLQRGHPLGPAPKKSLALQAGQMVLPDVAPILGRSGADVVASLAGPAAPVVAPMPSMVAEQAAVTAPS